MDNQADDSTEPLYLRDEEASMVMALVAAAGAGQHQEVPVGAVLRDEAGRILAEFGNDTVTSSDPTGHAELRVLRQGAARLGNYRLMNASLTVTLEPCSMCYAALNMARINTVTYAAKNPLSADKPLINQTSIRPIPVHDHEYHEEAGQLLKIFFANKRDI